MTESELDALLAKPLAPVADNSFSQKLLAQIVEQESGFTAFEIGTIVAALALVVLFVPVARLTAPFETIAINLGLSLPFAVACAALALTYASLRLLPD